MIANWGRMGSVVALCCALPLPAWTAGVVTECTQDALLEAIAGGGEVSFDCGADQIEISSEIDFGSIEVSIDGASPAGTMQLVAAPDAATRILRVRDSATVSLSNLVIRGGQADNGGGVRNFGTLTLRAIAVTDSSASAVGGGIANFGVLDASDLRLAGNTADSVGGGLYSSGLATVTRASVVDNTAGVAGAGIDNQGRLTLTNATVAGNVSGATGALHIAGAASADTVLNHVVITGNRLTDPNSEAAAGLVVDEDGFVTVSNSVIVGNGVGGQCFLPGTVSGVAGSVAVDASCAGFVIASADAINLGPRAEQVVATGPDQTVFVPTLPTVLLDAADEAACAAALVGAVDQVGQSRPLSEGCDIGSIELDVNRPVVDLNGAAAGRTLSATYAEGAGEQLLIPDVVVSGGDLTVLQQAQVVLDPVGDAAAETLSVDPGATGLTVSYAAADGLLTIAGEAAPADYAAVLATLSYQYDGPILGDNARLVDVQVLGDTLNSSPSRVTLRLEPVNDAPVATDDAYATTADQVLIVDAPGVLGNDSDADAQTLSASADGRSDGGAPVVLSSNGRLVFDPTTVYAGLSEGVVVEDGFNYFVSDGAGGSDQGRVLVTVTGVNDPPVATDDRFVLTEDGVVTSPAPGVLANDNDPDSGDSLTVVDVAATTSSGLAVSVGADGAVAFDPRASAQVQGLRQGQLQRETLTYTVADRAGLQATAQIRFDIQGRNDSPTAVALGRENLFVDQAASLSVAPAFSDVDTGDVLTYTAPGLPASLTLGTTSGAVTGTPTEDEVGRYALNVSVFDEAGKSATTQWVLVIERVGNDAPLIAAPVDDMSLDEGESWNLLLIDVFEDPDGDVLSYAVTGLPSGLELTGDTISGAPDLGTAGRYTVVLTATDPSDASTDSEFTLTVTEPERDLAVAVAAEATVVAPNAAFLLTATVSNPGTSLAGGVLELRVTGSGLVVPVPDGCSQSVAVTSVLLTCSLENLAAGEQQSLTIETEADRAGGLWLQATVGDPDSDSHPDDNRASTGVVVTELLAELPGTEFELLDGTRLAVLDADGDGAPDIAVGTGAGRATRLFRQTEDKEFVAAGTLGDVGNVQALLAGGFDGEAGDDLVVINASGGHALYSNNGQGGFALAAASLGDGEGLDALAADLDEDGAPDLVILEAGAAPRVYFSEGDDGFFATTLEPADAISTGLADIDGDGRPEPVFGLADGDVFQPTIGRRSYGARLALPSTGATHWLGADFDGDGDGDLMAATPETTAAVSSAPALRLLRSQPRNVVEQGARIDLGLTRRMAAADLDGDGDMDAVSASPAGVVQLYRNDGNGRLSVHDTAIEADAIDLALADMDQDGDVDLVLLLGEPAVVQVWFNQGELTFSDAVGEPERLHSDDGGSGAFGLWALCLLLAGGAARVRRASRQR